MVPRRVVLFQTRTVVRIIGIVLAAAVVVEVVLITRHVLEWIFVALFLALALNPAVEWLQAHGVRRRGAAAGVTFVLALGAFALIGWAFVPTVVHQTNQFVDAVPGYIEDLTKGRGRLGFLETKYHIVEKVRREIAKGGATRVLGLSGTAIAITKSIVTIVVATITIAFMTFFMLLEGRVWVDRFLSLLPEESRPRWRAVGYDIYRSVGGYVTGNLLISVIAGAATTVVLLVMGVPYAVALGLLVAILDLIPLAGATIAAIAVGIVAFLHSVPAGIVAVSFFIVYQQIENHFLQPVIYGKTVQLSPLAVLISVLIGAEIAGILGALGAIPFAGAIQVVLRDWIAHRGSSSTAPLEAAPGDSVR